MAFSTDLVRLTTSLPSVSRGLSPPRPTSAYPSYEESQQITTTRSQNQLKQLIAEELVDAVFESLWTIFHRSTRIKNWAKQREHAIELIFTERRVVAVSEYKAYQTLARAPNGILRYPTCWTILSLNT